MPNTLEAVMPKILSQGLLALRGQTILPSIVNTDFDTEVAQKGDTINVPIPSAVTASAVTPAETPPAGSGVTPTTAPIKLDQWFDAGFYMTDKDMAEVSRGIIPMQVSEAVKALAEKLNATLFDTYHLIYGAAGAAATTPFGSNYSEATAARKLLNKQKAPSSDRRIVLDPDAEENAINLKEFADSSFTSEGGVILNGVIGRKLGFDWFYDQQVPTHVAGTPGGTPVVKDGGGALVVGADEVVVDGLTATTGDYHKGDIITFAGHAQQYAVKEDATASGAGEVTIKIEPGLVAVPADGEAVSLVASHAVNLAFHRDAFALAVRPLEAEGNGLGNLVMTATDPETRLPLRLEVSREHKRTKWSFDILWGVALVRPALATRILG